MSSALVASYRKARAVELAMAGLSYDQIAHELGYANRGTAWRTVQSALKERRFAAVDAYRDAELNRLNRLGDRYERRCLAGELRAVNGFIRVFDQRMRLMGLSPQASKESNRCTCDCPIHGSHGSWRPTLRVVDAPPYVDEPSNELVAQVEQQMEAWADEVGVWALFQVMTVIAQVMELVRRAELCDEPAADL